MFGNKSTLNESQVPKKGFFARLKYRLEQMKAKHIEEEKAEEEAERLDEEEKQKNFIYYSLNLTVFEEILTWISTAEIGTNHSINSFKNGIVICLKNEKQRLYMIDARKGRATIARLRFIKPLACSSTLKWIAI